MDKTVQAGSNLLPFDGVVYYYAELFSRERSLLYFDLLMQQVAWKPDEVVLFGKRHVTRRKTAWYGDEPYEYIYSNTTRKAMAWTPALLELKDRITVLTGETFNSCLLNLYHNGDEGMGWHSDDERTIVKNSTIASVSFGAERSFSFRHKQSKTRITTVLGTGSVLVMKGTTQANWLHSLPKSKKIKDARINLTFRTMIPQPATTPGRPILKTP